MRLTGHEIGVLKGYMQDLVEQARQETLEHFSWRYPQKGYTHDDAIMDLLAILDDRVESEGLQVGLSEGFPHQMWGICDEARDHIRDMVWLSSNLGAPSTKVEVRETAYRALLEFIEAGFNEE